MNNFRNLTIRGDNDIPEINFSESNWLFFNFFFFKKKKKIINYYISIAKVEIDKCIICSSRVNSII